VASVGSTPATLTPDRIADFFKLLRGNGDVIDYATALSVGGNDSQANSSQASINTTTGIASFASGRGTTLSDALADIAARFTNACDAAGEFALFRINNTGDFHLFISDGVAGVTTNDVLIQLAGVRSFSGISLTAGDLMLLN